jgi:hypothetical protein
MEMPVRSPKTTVTLALIAAVAAIVALLPAGANAAAQTQAQRAAARKQPPLYWGAWIGPQLTGEEAPWDMSAVNQFEGVAGKGLSLIALGSPFANCPTPGSDCTFYDFPERPMDNVHAYGAIPFFNWASQETSAGSTALAEMPDFQLADVIAGNYDSYIHEFAEAARNWGHSFFLRYDWEMNGGWFPWGVDTNGNQAGEYVAAWRHVHDIFTSVGATNVSWVWCPFAEESLRLSALKPLYPGSRYVDWTCMDGFNRSANPSSAREWKSFRTIFGSTYRRLVTKIAPHKPVIIAETASNGPGHAKAKWIREMFTALHSDMRRIRGLIWYDQFDRGLDWPLETSAAASRAFARGIDGHDFKSNGPPATVGSPIPPPD